MFSFSVIIHNNVMNLFNAMNLFKCFLWNLKIKVLFLLIKYEIIVFFSYIMREMLKEDNSPLFVQHSVIK